MKFIERIPNQRTGGNSCVFEHKGAYYFADKSYVPFCGIETMIFRCNEKGEVTDWGELYCDRSGKSLDSCITEFLNNNLIKNKKK